MSCHICTENYSDDRPPLTLDCSHCMCRVCYVEYYEKFHSTVTCPECQRPTTKPPGNLNVNLAALREGKGQSSTTTTGTNRPLSQVKVIDMTNKHHLYDVRGSDTVLTLKRKIEERTGMPANTQSLLYRAKAMENESTLSSINVQDRAIINLVKKYNGGN